MTQSDLDKAMGDAIQPLLNKLNPPTERQESPREASVNFASKKAVAEALGIPSAVTQRSRSDFAPPASRNGLRPTLESTIDNLRKEIKLKESEIARIEQSISSLEYVIGDIIQRQVD
jgi:hypothetical protein